MNDFEFSRFIKLKALPPGALELSASSEECAALAERFGIESVGALVAQVSFDPSDQKIRAVGQMTADVVQICAISGENFAHPITEDLDFVFVSASRTSAELLGPDSKSGAEIELDSEELDEIEYEGDGFDLGEAIAQSLGLAIDPYAEGPNADAARKAAGIIRDDEPSGPLAEALKALKDDSD